MNPVRTIEEALKQIDAFQGDAADFALAFPTSLQDPEGMNMAIITDRILGRGWEPAGFERREGFRVYRYKEID